MKIGKLIVATAAVAAATGSIAQTTWQTYGNQTFGTSQNGSSQTWTTYGNQSFGTSSSGGMRTCTTYGSQTFCN